MATTRVGQAPSVTVGDNERVVRWCWLYCYRCLERTRHEVTAAGVARCPRPHGVTRNE